MAGQVSGRCVNCLLFWRKARIKQKISGFYVFYAPNQAMQEYLVDHHEKEKEDKPEGKVKRQPMQEGLPVKEVAVSARNYRARKKKKENQKENAVYCNCIYREKFTKKRSFADHQCKKP